MIMSLLLWLTALSTVQSLDLNFDDKLAKFALEFAAGAYSPKAQVCSAKNNATLLLRVALPCDYVGDECWGTISLTDEWIIVAFRGTKTKLQLITELIETMSNPKKATYPDHKIMFTGHSLGGALASLASTVFSYRHNGTRTRLYLFTFGEPRVGNYEYAQAHDMLVPRSWRIVHKYDLVAHLPACYTGIRHRSCFPFHSHGPYHHGTEVWYPQNMTASSEYRLCSGLPVNEDDLCSNGYYVHFGILDHLFYYEHHVSDYGENGCKDPPESLKKLISEQPIGLR